METPIAPSPLVLLIGAETTDGRLIQGMLRDDGCRVTPLSLPSALHPASGDAACLLVAVIEGDRRAARRIITRLERVYAPSYVVVGRDLTPPLRALAFARGAMDVIGLPMAPTELRARLRAAMAL